MIKRKGIYIEKNEFGKPFSIICYDGNNLVVIPINKGVKPKLFIKYSGTTFKDINGVKTTIKDVVSTYCPKGVNYICDNITDFPLIDINTILKGVLNEKYGHNQTN